MRLVYLSPVPWSSFAQRPHKFVEWFHARMGDDVLWLDPYPTRFPSLSDAHRLGRTTRDAELSAIPPWLRVIRPFAFPIEPLPGSAWVNALIWRPIFHELEAFAAKRKTLLAIGKPSALATLTLKHLSASPSVYDGMDDFPAFYSGISRRAMRSREQKLVRSVSIVLASSTKLKERWSFLRPDVRLVRNGLDLKVLPPPRISDGLRSNKVLGYVGTIGAWLDWEWLIALAKARPADEVTLIGPTFAPPPAALPNNIRILPPRTHPAALIAMQDFDVGLVPFKKNELTASVDPIKYYEYRALGLPVISTDFGEMALRKGEEGTFISGGVLDIGQLVQRALCYIPQSESVRQFALSSSWDTRFDNAGIIEDLA